MMMMFGELYLTEDLVMDILLKLPVIDVVRLKCVCKSLYSLINRSDFITNHFLVDRDPYMLVPMLLPGTGIGITRILSYNNTLGGGGGVGVIHTPKVYCFGCCDGVLFVTFSSRSFALWNPATGDIKPIPSYDHYARSYPPNDSPFGVTNYGCGFYSKTNGYRPFFVLSDQESFTMEIEIYSYKKKFWKIIRSSGIISLSGNIRDTLYANGIFHWIGFIPNGNDGNNGREVIVSFDISNEVILTTPFPDAIILTYSYIFPHYDPHYCPYPLLLNESLALVVNQHGHRSTDDRKTSCFDIWILGEYGNKDSWTKLFTVGPLPGIQHVLGFWNETKIFLTDGDWAFYDCQLLLYDTLTQQSFNCFQTIPSSSTITFYRPSLFPIFDGSKKTKIKKGIRVRVRVRLRVFPIEIIRRTQKKKLKTINDENVKYFVVIKGKKVFLG